MASGGSPSLREEVFQVLTRYKDDVRAFAQIIRDARTAAADIQPELLARMDVIFAVDKELQEAFKRVNEQQSHLVKMQRLQDELAAREKHEKQLADRIFEAIVAAKDKVRRDERKVEMLKGLCQGDPSNCTSRINGLDTEMILAMAERFSLTAGPPEGWQMDQPLILHRPPYPTEDLMRASHLFQLMNVSATAPAQEGKKAEGTLEHHKREQRRHAEEDEEPSFLNLDLNPDLL